MKMKQCFKILHGKIECICTGKCTLNRNNYQVIDLLTVLVGIDPIEWIIPVTAAKRLREPPTIDG